MFGKIFIDVIVPEDWLLDACFRILIKVVARTVPDKDTTGGSKLSEKLLPVHTFKSKYLILWLSGTSSKAMSK